MSYFLKISFLGDYSKEKAQIRNRFCGKGFRTENLLTIGADFASKDQILSTGENVTFQIWDLAPQNLNNSVRSRFNRGSMGAMIIFDLSSQFSFLRITKWIEEIWKSSGRGIVPIVLLGIRLDNKGSKIITCDRVNLYVDAISDKMQLRKGFGTKYFEINIITGHNIDAALDYLGTTIVDSINKGKLKLK